MTTNEYISDKGKMMNELPIRKQIRLKGYDYSQCGYYFITVCTYRRQHLFGEIVGATLCGRPNNPDKMIEKWLLELENKFFGVKICEYVIMPDHIHFIISNTGDRTRSVTGDHTGSTGDHAGSTGDHTGSPLRDIVGWFKTMTTNEYIRNVKNNIYPPFDKKIWQRNYYEHIIRDEKDYAARVEYIFNNPLKWELEHNGG